MQCSRWACLLRKNGGTSKISRNVDTKSKNFLHKQYCVIVCRMKIYTEQENVRERRSRVSHALHMAQMSCINFFLSVTLCRWRCSLLGESLYVGLCWKIYQTMLHVSSLRGRNTGGKHSQLPHDDSQTFHPHCDTDNELNLQPEGSFFSDNGAPKAVIIMPLFGTRTSPTRCYR